MAEEMESAKARGSGRETVNRGGQVKARISEAQITGQTIVEIGEETAKEQALGAVQMAEGKGE